MLETSVSSSLCGENLPFINLFDTKFSCFPPTPTRHQSFLETKPFISEKPVPLHTGTTWSGTYFLSFECIAEYLRSCEWHPAKEVKDDGKGGTFICSLKSIRFFHRTTLIAHKPASFWRKKKWHRKASQENGGRFGIFRSAKRLSNQK